MAFKFPFSTLHELNLDWILEKVKTFAELIPPMETAVSDVQELSTDVQQAVEDAQQALEDAGEALQTAEEAKEIAEQAAQGTIADGAVTTAKLDDGAVTTAKLDDGAVTGAKIASGTIQTGNLSSGCVTTTQILDGTISPDDLGTECVTNSKLSADSVTTSKINDGAVTTAKLYDGAVNNAKIQDGAVTKVKLGTDALEDLIFPAGTYTMEVTGFGWTTSGGADTDIYYVMPKSLIGRTVSNVSTSGSSIRTGKGGYISGYDEISPDAVATRGTILRLIKIKSGGWGVDNNMAIAALATITFTVS